MPDNDRMSFMRDELISVVVPIYNAEKYIKRCVDSILSQTYANLQVILMDDGSTDGTPDILDSYSERDKRVTVIHKENVGHAHSRNMGLKAATGEFITFMDCDDYMFPDFIEKMYGAICEDDSDMACCSFNYVDEAGNKLGWSEPQLDRKCVDPHEAQRDFLTTYNIEGFSWNKLVRRQILIDNDLSYEESQKAFVDMFLWYRALGLAKRISYVPDKLYNYYQMSGSVVHTIDDTKMRNFYTTIHRIEEDARKNGLEREGVYYSSFRMFRQVFDQMKEDIKSGFKLHFNRKYRWADLFSLSKKQTKDVIGSMGENSSLRRKMEYLLVRTYIRN